jgi:hypothetical protein
VAAPPESAAIPSQRLAVDRAPASTPIPAERGRRSAANRPAPHEAISTWSGAAVEHGGGRCERCGGRRRYAPHHGGVVSPAGPHVASADRRARVQPAHDGPQFHAWVQNRPQPVPGSCHRGACHGTSPFRSSWRPGRPGIIRRGTPTESTNAHVTALALAVATDPVASATAKCLGFLPGHRAG